MLSPHSIGRDPLLIAASVAFLALGAHGKTPSISSLGPSPTERDDSIATGSNRAVNLSWNTHSIIRVSIAAACTSSKLSSLPAAPRLFLTVDEVVSATSSPSPSTPFSYKGYIKPLAWSTLTSKESASHSICTNESSSITHLNELSSSSRPTKSVMWSAAGHATILIPNVETTNKAKLQSTEFVNAARTLIVALWEDAINDENMMNDVPPQVHTRRLVAVPRTAPSNFRRSDGQHGKYGLDSVAMVELLYTCRPNQGDVHDDNVAQRHDEILDYEIWMLWLPNKWTMLQISHSNIFLSISAFLIMVVLHIVGRRKSKAEGDRNYPAVGPTVQQVRVQNEEDDSSSIEMSDSNDEAHGRQCYSVESAALSGTEGRNEEEEEEEYDVVVKSSCYSCSGTEEDEEVESSSSSNGCSATYYFSSNYDQECLMQSKERGTAAFDEDAIQQKEPAFSARIHHAENKPQQARNVKDNIERSVLKDKAADILSDGFEKVGTKTAQNNLQQESTLQHQCIIGETKKYVQNDSRNASPPNSGQRGRNGGIDSASTLPAPPHTFDAAVAAQTLFPTEKEETVIGVDICNGLEDSADTAPALDTFQYSVAGPLQSAILSAEDNYDNDANKRSTVNEHGVNAETKNILLQRRSDPLQATTADHLSTEAIREGNLESSAPSPDLTRGQEILTQLSAASAPSEDGKPSQEDENQSVRHTTDIYLKHIERNGKSTVEDDKVGVGEIDKHYEMTHASSEGDDAYEKGDLIGVMTGQGTDASSFLDRWAMHLSPLDHNHSNNSTCTQLVAACYRPPEQDSTSPETREIKEVERRDKRNSIGSYVSTLPPDSDHVSGETVSPPVPTDMPAPPVKDAATVAGDDAPASRVERSGVCEERQISTDKGRITDDQQIKVLEELGQKRLRGKGEFPSFMSSSPSDAKHGTVDSSDDGMHNGGFAWQDYQGDTDSTVEVVQVLHRPSPKKRRRGSTRPFSASQIVPDWIPSRGLQDVSQTFMEDAKWNMGSKNVKPSPSKDSDVRSIPRSIKLRRSTRKLATS